MIPQPSLDYKTLKKYLADRGLTNELIYAKVGIEFAGPDKCRRFLNLPADSMDRRLGIVFHYPVAQGEEPYASVRWFGRYTGAFGQSADIKLQCPTGRNVRAYVSPLANLEEGGTAYICESVLKAIVVSQSGRYSIGGNGVRCYYVRGEFVPGFPLEDLGRARRIVILFDNDTKTNPDVASARRTLTKHLRDRFPKVEIKWGELPDPPGGGKWGVDDYIAGGGKVEDIPLIDAAATDGEKLVDELNEKYCVCLHPPCVIRKDTGNTYTRADFIGLLESHRKIWLGEKQVEGSRFWLSTEGRSIAETITYRPGAERFAEGKFFNLWQDSGTPAKEGDISPFLKVYENAIPDDVSRNLLFKSFAWILQNRGVKLEKNFVFVSRQVGTGKSLLGEVFRSILGTNNSANISMTDFSGSFNAVFAAKELVVIDDLHSMSRKEIADLKRYTTAARIVVNTKNVKQYEVDNTAVFILTTNELSSLPMGDEERRNLVVSFDPTVHYPSGDQWWKDYTDWLASDGVGVVRWWLEHMDLSEFDPYYMPPMNEVKREMVSASRSAEEGFVIDLASNPDVFLAKTGRSVFTTEELWFVYMGTPPDRGDLIRLGRALGDKFKQADSGRFMRILGRKPNRYWVVRGREREWGTKEVGENLKSYPDISN